MPNFAILFLGIYSWGVLGALFLGPTWAFYLYQLVYFFNPDSRWWGNYIPGLRYSFIVSFILLLSFYTRLKDYTHNRLLSVPQSKYFILILIVYALTYFVAVNPIPHEKALIALLKMFLVLYVAYKVIDTASKLDFALWSFIVGATYIGLEANRVGRNGNGRVEGIGTVDSPEANGTAAAISPTLVLLIFYLWQGANKKVKLLAVICGAIVANGVVLINSRGSFVGLVCGAGYFLLNMIFGGVQQDNQRATALLVILISLGGALYVTDDLFWDRMFTISSDDDRKSGSHRTGMWLSSIDLVKDYPFGVGAYGFQTLSKNYVPEELFFYGQKTKSVHSSWFQALSEVGWFGFAIFLLLIASSFRQTHNLKRTLKGNHDHNLYFKVLALESAFICYLGAASFVDLFRAEILYWLIMFIACLNNIVNQKYKG